MIKILVVEDDADLVETYVDLLGAKGFAVLSASNVGEAIQLVGNLKPAIVILDLSLPGGHGMEVLDFVRDQPTLESTKVIVVTGHAEMTNTYAIEKADIVMTKPISNDHLIKLIERLLGLSKRVMPASSVPSVPSGSPASPVAPVSKESVSKEPASKTPASKMSDPESHE